jgi:hypothetical protein
MSLESDGRIRPIYWQEKTEELGEKPVPLPLCPPQIPHGLTRARTPASAVRDRRLTTWAMARPRTALQSCQQSCSHLLKMTVFWDVAPTSLVEIDRRFRNAYCRHYQSDESVLYQTAQRNIPEDNHLHTCRRESSCSSLSREVSRMLSLSINSLTFTEPEGVVPCSQEPVAAPILSQINRIHAYPVFLISILTLHT